MNNEVDNKNEEFEGFEGEESLNTLAENLKKDYKETLKYFEQRMKAEKQSAKKSSKVTIQNVKNTGKSSKSNQK